MGGAEDSTGLVVMGAAVLTRCFRLLVVDGGSFEVLRGGFTGLGREGQGEDPVAIRSASLEPSGLWLLSSSGLRR